MVTNGITVAFFNISTTTAFATALENVPGAGYDQ
jgi:hypothetical protein